MKKEGEMGREMIKRDKNREIRWGKEREGERGREGAGTARKGGPGM